MPAFAFLFFDPTMILLIPAIALAFWAQNRVRSAYAKYLQVPSRRGRTGAEVAQEILSRKGMGGVQVLATRGQLDDHYDPRKRTVNLSPDVYSGTSLASLAIAAHESGHAMQHNQGWFPLAARSAIAPTVGFGSTLAFPLFIIGFIFSSMRILMDVGILLFGLAVLFHMITLPVEFDASRRAMSVLKDGGYLTVEESGGAKRVLDAAAWTYVAAATMAVMNLARMLLLRGSRD
jgi:hypothetical protein